MRLAIVSFISILAFITGCSSSVSLDGEAFIDSKGGATKLALVEIQVVPVDKFVSHIKKQIPMADAEATKLSEWIIGFKKRDAEAQALIAQSAMLQQQTFLLGTSRGGAMIAAEGAHASRELATSMNESRSIAAKKSDDLRGISTGANKVYFAGKIDGAVLSTSTDADGKFKLSVPAGEKVVIVAVKDDLAWALWRIPDKSQPTLTLSNKNLSGTNQCSDCVFDGIVTPKSLTGS